jgi:predicted amidohydrolase
MNLLGAVFIVLGLFAHLAPAQDAAPSDKVTRNRLLRVVTVSQDGLDMKPGRAMLDQTLQRLEAAAAFRPDIVCLPERFTYEDSPPTAQAAVEPIARWARSNGCYVICPLLVRDGERIYNSALLLDRNGELVGRYDKIRPTENELERGISPGAVDPPVFHTDFGTIGIQICFDVNWRRQWQQLKRKGAQIVFFPSAYPAARQLSALAWWHQSFIVSSTRRGPASIYDITGERMATTGQYRQWAGAVVPLGKRLFEIDFHTDKMRQIQRKYGDKVQIKWYHDDDLVTLASLDDGLTVDDLVREFALTPHSAYMARAGQAQDAQR